MNNQSDIRIEQPVLKRLAEHVLKKIDRGDSELSVVLVDVKTIQEMNKTYRGVDRPTDVLSFNLEDDHEDNFFGDVIISPEVAENNIKDSGVDLLCEVKELLVHGILHLDGKDHKDLSEAKKMENEQKELLSSFDELIF